MISLFPFVGTCGGPVCDKFGHSASSHDVIAAVAMWCSNACLHCKAAASATLPPRALTPAGPVEITPDVGPGPVSVADGGYSAIPVDDETPPVTLDDDELINVIATDGYGILMDEQVCLKYPLYLLKMWF